MSIPNLKSHNIANSELNFSKCKSFFLKGSSFGYYFGNIVGGINDKDVIFLVQNMYLSTFIRAEIWISTK